MLSLAFNVGRLVLRFLKERQLLFLPGNFIHEFLLLDPLLLLLFVFDLLASLLSFGLLLLTNDDLISLFVINAIHKAVLRLAVTGSQFFIVFGQFHRLKLRITNYA